MKRFTGCAAASLIALILLTGCGKGEKVAVRINKDAITEDEFNKRTQNINGNELYASYRNRGPAKAGELAMQNIIQEKLILQLAAEKRAQPTEAQVVAYLEAAKNYPQLAAPMGLDPLLSEAEKRRDARVRIALHNMAVKPLNITQADLQKLYDDPMQKQRLIVSEQYHLRLIVVTTQQKAQEALTVLAKNVPFETVALKMSDDPGLRQKNGDIGFVSADNPQAMPLIAGVKNLKPLAYTPTPISLAARLSNGTMQTTYAIAQMVEKKPGRTPSLENVRFFLEEAAMSQKDASAFQRIQEQFREQVKKADIQVNLKQYENIAKQMKEKAAAPAPSGAPAQGP